MTSNFLSRQMSRHTFATRLLEENVDVFDFYTMITLSWFPLFIQKNAHCWTFYRSSSFLALEKISMLFVSTNFSQHC